MKYNMLFNNIQINENIIQSFNECLNKCEFLYIKYKMPKHIRLHSISVGIITAIIINYLITNKKVLNNIDTLINGALLHDIAKNAEIDGTHSDHAIYGAQLLQQEGLVYEALLCEYHTVSGFLLSNICFDAKMINLADRLVNNHIFVTLEERFNYLRTRYNDHIYLFDNNTVVKYINFAQELGDDFMTYYKSINQELNNQIMLTI